MRLGLSSLRRQYCPSLVHTIRSVCPLWLLATYPWSSTTVSRTVSTSPTTVLPQVSAISWSPSFWIHSSRRRLLSNEHNKRSLSTTNNQNRLFTDDDDDDNNNNTTTTTTMPTTMTNVLFLNQLQDLIGTDIGNRGMKALICSGDLATSCHALALLSPTRNDKRSLVLVLTGFPCCVNETPPTETDGPPGACSIAQTALALGHDVVLLTDECNTVVLQAASQHLLQQYSSDSNGPTFSITSLPGEDLEDPSSNKESLELLQRLAKDCAMVIACERAGPGPDGHCYTMRATDMTAKGLIAPIHKLIEYLQQSPPDNNNNNNNRTKPLFLAIGDGGNELGMGKVHDRITSPESKIPLNNITGCVIAADYLIAASVSNWGGYALSVGTAFVKAHEELTSNESSTSGDRERLVQKWLDKCVPTRQAEIDLLQRCVDKGCRDGVSGKVEATVDGFSLETSLDILDSLRNAAIEASKK